MNNIEYGNKLIRLGKLMKNDKTKLKALVSASLDCGLIYTYGLTPQPNVSVELNLSKPDMPLPLVAATLLAKLAVDMEDTANVLQSCGEESHWSELAEQLRGAANSATDWSKVIQADCA